MILNKIVRSGIRFGGYRMSRSQIMHVVIVIFLHVYLSVSEMNRVYSERRRELLLAQLKTSGQWCFSKDCLSRFASALVHTVVALSHSVLTHTLRL